MKPAIICVLFQIASALQAQTVMPALAGRDIRVASHNMLFEYSNRVPEQSERRWKSRKPHLKDLYSRCKVDIIGSQEILGWQGLEFMEATGYAAVGVNQIGFPEGTPKAMKCEYERIFYRPERFAVLQEGHFWFSENPDIPQQFSWDATHTRMCTWAKFQERESGVQFYVFNSHFHYDAMRSRLESAKLLLDRVKKVAGAAPVILTGDFNGLITSEAISLIDNSGIVFDSRKLAGENVKGPATSFHGFNTNLREGFIIDHIFVSCGIKVNSYIIVDDEIRTGKYTSDHFPVFVDITLPDVE